MANPNKAKGTTWETAIVNLLADKDIPAYRPAQAGAKDTGDIHGVDPFIIQAKNWKDVTSAVREGSAGAKQQAIHAGRDYGVAFIKRHRASADKGYAVMEIGEFVRLMKEIRRGREDS